LNSDFDYVIHSNVVMGFGDIREPILRDITAEGYEVMGFSLTCSEETLTERHRKRGDDGEVDFQWLRAPPYPNDYVINTDDKTVMQIVSEIKSVIN
jgi:hypothetical protein